MEAKTKFLNSLAKKITTSSKIWISPYGVEKILRAIKTTTNHWLIIRLAEEPINVVNKALALLKQLKIIKTEKNKVTFTTYGKKLAKELKIEKLIRPECQVCEGRGINFRFDDELYQLFLRIQRKRPRPARAYDQGNVTPATTIARVLLALAHGDIQDKDVLALGAEDDLLGLAIALTKKAKRVVVLDIDERLITLDNYWAKKLNLNLEARVFDLRKPLTKDLIGSFDTFFTDPSETVASIKGFILKGVAALKGPGSVGYFGFTLKDSSLTKWYILQKILNENKIVITEILREFNFYENWPYLEETKSFKESIPRKRPERTIWYTSNWYRLVTLPGFKRLNIDLTKYKGKKFYDDVENSTS